MELDIGVLGLASDVVALFSESQGRFVVTVAPSNVDAFEQTLEGVDVARLGVVTEADAFRVKGKNGPRIDVSIAELKKAWQEPLAW